jgi:cytidine deaminase
MRKNLRFEDLDSDQQRLLIAAYTAMRKAIAPCSGFTVGAALLSVNKQLISAANYESVAYSPSICAERSAFMAGNSKGVRSYSKIAVIACGKDSPALSAVSPCGTCRQVIFEYSHISGVDIEVIMSNTSMTDIIIANISELLPLAFGPKDLGIDLSKYA